MTNTNTHFKIRNSHKMALFVSVVLWTIIIAIVLYAMCFSLERYLTEGDMSQVVSGLLVAAFFIFFEIWILAIATESIEVRDDILIIRYLFFKKIYPVSSITEVYTNTIYGRYRTTYTVGVYIDNKRIVLPLQPEPTWEGFWLWDSFTSSLEVKKTFEDGTAEMWPFGKIGRRKSVEKKQF